MGENLDGTVVVDGGSSLIYPFVERVDSLITRCTSMVINDVVSVELLLKAHLVN